MWISWIPAHTLTTHFLHYWTSLLTHAAHMVLYKCPKKPPTRAPIAKGCCYMYYVIAFTDNEEVLYLADANEYDGSYTWFYAVNTLTLFSTEFAARKAMEEVKEPRTLQQYEIVDFTTHRTAETVLFQEQGEYYE